MLVRAILKQCGKFLSRMLENLPPSTVRVGRSSRQKSDASLPAPGSAAELRGAAIGLNHEVCRAYGTP